MKCNIQSAPVEQWEWTIEEIVSAQKDGHLHINPEYQRGAVWTLPQMRMLIDSLLRGYYIPLIYLHRVEGRGGVRHEVIDGQQRINAICSFVAGEVVQTALGSGNTHKAVLQFDKGRAQRFGALYDPSQERDRKRFPAFLHEQKCWWGGKKFNSDGSGVPFKPEEQQEFLNKKIAVAIVECEPYEARDMFIRLQGGAELRAQEKRDAWPGNFGDLIFDIGGKVNLRSGHPFFSRVIGLSRPDRGETRELAAEMLMLFLNRNALGGVALGADALDGCYREHINLEVNSPEVKRFCEILDHLAGAFSGGKSPLGKNKKPYSIHLMLLVDLLLDAAPEKVKGIAGAFSDFREEMVKWADLQSPPESEDANTQQLWNFSQALKVRGSTAKDLADGHGIFVRQMSRFLGISDIPLSRGDAESTSGAVKAGSGDLPQRELAKVKPNLTVREVGDLTKERKSELLKPDEAYQRSEVWKPDQRRLFIDSVLRNYQIPLLYLHKVQAQKHHPKLGASSELQYYIVDGQQRINSLLYFQDGSIPKDGKSVPFGALLNPKDAPDWFPGSITEQQCEWGGKTFDGLGQLQDEFKKKKMAVVEIECEADSAKDMFIRLQGGTPLDPQDVRDAWPGKFCELVLNLGGKQGHGLGHDFFRTQVQAAGKGGAKKRQLVAQLLMLYLSRKQHAAVDFVVVDGDKLDAYYRTQANLDLESDAVRRFYSILGKLLNLFGGAKPMKAAEVIHLVLFVDMLMGNYTPAWEDKIADAHGKFADEAGIVDAKRRKKETEGVNPDFLIYAENAAKNTTKSTSIRRRHEVYVRAMFGAMGDAIQRKDPKRAYTYAERETIFHRDKRKCHKCGKDVFWSDADIHHIKPHSEGGQTTLENGVLMCRECHRDLHAQTGKGGE